MYNYFVLLSTSSQRGVLGSEQQLRQTSGQEQNCRGVGHEKSSIHRRNYQSDKAALSGCPSWTPPQVHGSLWNWWVLAWLQTFGKSNMMQPFGQTQKSFNRRGFLQPMWIWILERNTLNSFHLDQVGECVRDFLCSPIHACYTSQTSPCIWAGLAGG